MKELKVRLTLTEELLGTASGNKQIHDEFIASKIYGREAGIPKNADDLFQEELDAIVEEAHEKGMTIFPRDIDDCPILYDYQLKGFFKDACKMLRKVEGTKSSKMKTYRQQIDGLIFVKPRKIRINLAGEMGDCQRPLRASTPMGERVALANSETVPAGSTIDFSVLCMVDSDMDTVKEWLDYGIYRGLGAWRNSGKGSFVWEEA